MLFWGRKISDNEPDLLSNIEREKKQSMSLE